MWQEIVVGVVVVLATLALLWRWIPQAWRRRLGGRAGGGCGACSACDAGGCSKTSAPPQSGRGH